MAAVPPGLVESGWSVEPDGRAIGRTFRFATFADAIAWMARVAFEAEALDHHPEWSNVYNRVTVRLTTHDTGGLTGKDFDLAGRMDRLFDGGAPG